MDDLRKQQQGTLKVSDEVISKIVKLAVSETEGVAGLPTQSVDFSKFLMNKKTENAIKVRLVKDVVEIDIAIIAKLGYKVSVLGEKIQERVKNDVQSMTGIMVSKVNVRIAGVAFEDGKDE